MTVRQGMALAEASGHPFALMHGHYFMSKIHRLRREPAETRDAAEATLALADEYQVPRELSDAVRRTYRRALARFGPADGELLAVALLEDEAGHKLRTARS
jgi:hypothetical protein